MHDFPLISMTAERRILLLMDSGANPGVDPNCNPKVLEGRMSSVGHVEPDQCWDLLFSYPIYEDGITLYCTVMNVHSGDYESLTGEYAA